MGSENNAGFLAFASFEQVRGWRDADGRPLGEAKAPPSLRDAVSTELISCDYQDLRSTSGLLMNVSALAQITTHWPTILDRIRLIRGAFVARSRRSHPSALDLWRIANAAVSVVSFHRLATKSTSVIPVFDTALFKASIGVKYALRHAEVARLQGIDAIGAYPSPATLWQYIVREGLLLGVSQVCAGPSTMIRELLDVLIDGRETNSGQAALCEPIDIEKLLAYADLLAIWETAALLTRTEERAGAGDAHRRLRDICRTMLRDVCTAVGFPNTPETAPSRQIIEARLALLFESGVPAA